MAYCGLMCDSCPIYLATLEKDVSQQKTMRESIADLCFTQYGMELFSEDITDCDGCKTKLGRLFSGCMDCKIRNCAKQKEIENCAFCDDYACDTLLKHFELDPSAKERLDKIWLTMHKKRILN